MKRLSSNAAVLLASASVCAVATASAQEKYPNRPIKVLVPYAPGGATDITARLVGDELPEN